VITDIYKHAVRWVNIVRAIEFVIKVGAGTVKACLVLNYRDKRHI
jgi:hypothetical protein